MIWLVLAALLLAIGAPGPAGPDGTLQRSERHSPPRSARPSRRPSRRALQLAAGSGSGALILALVPLPAAALVAACVVPLAMAATGRLHDRPAAQPMPAEAALALALTGAALRAGMPVPDAIELAAPAARDPTPLTRVAGLLRLGATAEQAWSVLTPIPGWSSIAVLAARSGHSGAKLADACERSAAELRKQQRTEAVSRAQRVSVLAVGPLGACFLPAFVCLGIAPIVVGVAVGLGGQLG